MYADYFGLKENPFSLSPDARYLFRSEQHRDALNSLIYGIKEKKGFVLISGGIGLGKTTICRSLLASLDDSVETALIFNTAISDLDLLETILGEYGIDIKNESRNKKYYIDVLNEFLLKNFAAGKTAVLLVDEAQNLSHGVLEQIRMLSNLETETEKLIQIILIGQPELNNTLMLPALRQLNERITVRYDLKPFSPREVSDYIQHRLTVAQGPGSIKFTGGALNLIYFFAEGIPRRINALCDRALLIAYTKNTSKIDRRIVKLAVHDIGLDYFQKTMSSGRKLWARLTT
ncbi:MAG: ATPase [Deltaproteobacteria bacterium HGW-Deltaproteobacteria-13]|jgi:general secretion pathway protein A|nr:MAG: ATPase [Deltaproteobacteria bacterium HGW-Deltaproteobacteria-13]